MSQQKPAWHMLSCGQFCPVFLAGRLVPSSSSVGALPSKCSQHSLPKEVFYLPHSLTAASLGLPLGLF